MGGIRGYGGRHWNQVVDNLRAGVAAIDASVCASKRRDVSHKTSERYVFGQWVFSTENSNGQFGLTGTAAAASLLARGPHHPDDKSRLQVLSDALSFLADRARMTEDGSAAARLSKTNLVLRQTQALNAAASLHGWNVHHAGAGVSDADLQTVLNKAIDVLVKARCQITLAGDQSVNSLRSVEGFHVGATTARDDLPSTVWAFHLASVIDAVTAAARVNLIDGPRVEELLTKASISQLGAWTIATLRNADPVDERVALFAGWALLATRPLECEPALDPPHTGIVNVGLDDIQYKRLSTQLRKAAHRILRSSDGRAADLHHPYDYSLPGSDDSQEYLADHFVVPTVPVAISTMARVDQQSVFSAGVNSATLKVLAAVTGTPRPGVVPEQYTHRNGTVNYMYARGALNELVVLAAHAKGRGVAWQATARARTAGGVFRLWASSFWGFVQTPIGFFSGAVLGGLLGTLSYESLVWLLTQAHLITPSP